MLIYFQWRCCRHSVTTVFQNTPNGWRVLKPKYTLFSPYSHHKSRFYRYRFHTRVWKSTLFLENCCFWYPKWCHLIHPSVLKNNPNSYRLSRTFTATAQLPKFCQPDFSILFFKLRTSVPDRSYEHQFR